MFYRDSFTLFLVGLVLCRWFLDQTLLRTFWGILCTRSVRLCDRPSIEKSCALGLSLVVLLAHQRDLIILVLAFLLVLLGGRKSTLFRPAWGLPALVLYGVFPSTWGTLLLLPVLFWPGEKNEDAGEQCCIGVIIALGLASHVAPFQAGVWMLGVVGVASMLSVWGYMRHQKALAEGAMIMRPLLLFGVMVVARGEGLGASAYAAMSALMLDVSVSVVAAVKPSWRLLTLAVPLFPGFIVMWLGIHAALGITTGAAGWTIAGFIVAALIALFSVMDFSRSLSALQSPRLTGALVVSATLLPMCVSFLAYFIAYYEGVGGVGHSLYDTLWMFQGGDGAVVAFPALLGLVFLCWNVIVRPWSLTSPVLLPRSITVSAMDQQRWCAVLLGGTVRFPWKWRRYVVFFRGYGREMNDRLRRLNVPFSEMSLMVWLLFLGVVFALLGLTA